MVPSGVRVGSESEFPGPTELMAGAMRETQRRDGSRASGLLRPEFRGSRIAARRLESR